MSAPARKLGSFQQLSAEPLSQRKYGMPGREAVC